MAIERATSSALRTKDEQADATWHNGCSPGPNARACGRADADAGGRRTQRASQAEFGGGGSKQAVGAARARRRRRRRRRRALACSLSFESQNTGGATTTTTKTPTPTAALAGCRPAGRRAACRTVGLSAVAAANACSTRTHSEERTRDRACACARSRARSRTRTSMKTKLTLAKKCARLLTMAVDDERKRVRSFLFNEPRAHICHISRFSFLIVSNGAEAIFGSQIAARENTGYNCAHAQRRKTKNSLMLQRR